MIISQQCICGAKLYLKGEFGKDPICEESDMWNDLHNKCYRDLHSPIKYTGSNQDEKEFNYAL